MTGPTIYRRYGPPGTGKTHRTVKDVANAAAEHGPENVIVQSFTRAAAVEIASRGPEIPKRNVGTVHSHCFNALERPTLAETKISDFNAYSPSFSLTDASKSTVDDPGEVNSGRTLGDDLFARYNLLRAKMIDRTYWGPKIEAFARTWEAWKEEEALYDFTDLIEACLERYPVAPNRPKVAFIDEAQDLSTLQFTLIKQWAQGMEFVILIGDDDQTIYTFSGADASNLIGHDAPDNHKFFLRQSYRVPVDILYYSQNWIHKIKDRQEKDYHPTKERGYIKRLSGDCFWRYPEGIIPHIQACLSQDETVMVLGSCAFMLDPLIKALRAEGIPFANRYRLTSGSWNPLSSSEGGMPNRMSMFIKGIDRQAWTGYQLWKWVEIINTKDLLKRGAKKQIKDLGENYPGTLFTLAEVLPYFQGNPFATKNPSVEWLISNALSAKKSAMHFPARIIAKKGLDALGEEPKLTVGTIHSVKGGEADHVILFPDLSRIAAQQWAGKGELRDAIVRTFYVGMTRARKGLILAAPHSDWSVPL